MSNGVIPIKLRLVCSFGGKLLKDRHEKILQNYIAYYIYYLYLGTLKLWM